MKFIIGYNYQENGTFTDEIIANADHIAEVYFPWINTATCRNSMNNQRGAIDWSAQKILENDLQRIRKASIQLDLLLNANCYGDNSISLYLQNLVCSIIEYIIDKIGTLDVITTASLSIAHIVKKYFPGINVRASVNMKIGTIEGMNYVSHLFDSYHMQRDYNRDLDRVRYLKEWADKNGKEMILLANSGCMRFCSGQIFHDNLVAHDQNICEIKSIPDFIPVLCEQYLKNRDNWVSILRNTWVRPEDIDHYSGYFDKIKLATRASANPARILNAYVNRKYYGNVLDIMEPGYGRMLYPHYLSNSRFPADWFNKTSNCNKQCDSCNYCENVLAMVLEKA